MPIFVGAGHSSFLHNNSVGIGTTTTAGRNAGVGTVKGQLAYNETISGLEVYNGVNWAAIKSPFEVTGGTKTTAGAYTYHTFESPGTCLLYTSPSPRDRQKSRMPSSA